MSKSKHTPGPWTKIRASDGTYGIAAGKTLLLSSELTLPDARLIETAPELLKALKNCVQHLDSGDYPENAEMRAAWEEAQEIIEKTEGVKNVKNK